MTSEEIRLQAAREKKAHWRRWGPYLSERQWGTVREDYSPEGNAWDYFNFHQAQSRAYRWGEDGIAGISDNHQRLCFSLAFWNGKDPFLKERLFGLSGPEGNHGEDVKEYYYHLDNTPTHSYMKYLYKYPQAEFPYQHLLEETRRRTRDQPEFELFETGVFEHHRYWDIVIEYAKGSPEDILVQITVVNRGDEEVLLYLLPLLWFRNTWSWEKTSHRPSLKTLPPKKEIKIIEAHHPTLGQRWVFFENGGTLLFCENESNHSKLFGTANSCPYPKDAFNDYLVHGISQAINPNQTGTRATVVYPLHTKPRQSYTLRFRLTDQSHLQTPFGKKFQDTLQNRQKEANDFYDHISPKHLPEDLRSIQRQAFAGLLWNRQFYHFVVEEWLKGDPEFPPPPPIRKKGRNKGWIHLYNDDILSMPDKWEYPWFAAWDLAIQAVPFAVIDPDFAKHQLILLTREWYMHPNGQIPAYEWSFGDANPPIHAWAAWRVYKIEQKRYGRRDRRFLERVFQKLLMNFTWWINRKDAEGKNIFQGGFLGLDNISVFDRNSVLPTGGHLEQSDGTSWMAGYCLNMLKIALELAQENSSYEDIASKFFEHFLYIANAMNKIGEKKIGLWDQQDEFYYDVLHLPDGTSFPLKVRSMVGLFPLYAIEILEPEVLDALPGFKKRMEWFIKNRPDLSKNVASLEKKGVGERRLLSVMSPPQLKSVLRRMLDEKEFLSPYGIRSLSRYHAEVPFEFRVQGAVNKVEYDPGESSSEMFGGNSNWRGPVWYPVNFLIIESLQKFHHYLGDGFTVEHPTGSGNFLNLWEVSIELSQRLIKIFSLNDSNGRPVYGNNKFFQTDPHWRNEILFYEYFHGETGAGLGASHQTGWTALVAKLILQCGEYEGVRRYKK